MPINHSNILALCSDWYYTYLNNKFKHSTTYNLTVVKSSEITQIGIEKFIDATITGIQNNTTPYQGIIATNSLVAAIAAVITKRTGLIGPSPEAVLRCQNKYISRMIQKECVPNNTPDFIVSSEYFKDSSQAPAFPLFIKPVKSHLSLCSYLVKNDADLRKKYMNQPLSLKKLM